MTTTGAMMSFIIHHPGTHLKKDIGGITTRTIIKIVNQKTTINEEMMIGTTIEVKMIHINKIVAIIEITESAMIIETEKVVAITDEMNLGDKMYRMIITLNPLGVKMYLL